MYTASAILRLIDTITTLYIWTLLAYVISSWLVGFGIINPWHPIARTVIAALKALHEPVLRPLRRLLYRLIPSTGQIDLSPIVAILLAYLIAGLLKDIVLTLI